MPAVAPAQSGSALFAVGESSAPTRGPAKPVAHPKADTVAAVAPAASAAPAAQKPAVAKGPPQKSPVAKRNTRGKNVARRPTSPIALNGRWHDSQCIPLTGITHKPPLYVKREYEFSDARTLRDLVKSPMLSKPVLMAACRSDQTAADALIEGRYNGAFTYHFVKSLQGNGTAGRAEVLKLVSKGLKGGGFDQVAQLEGTTAARKAAWGS